MAKTDRAFRALARAQPDVVAEMLRVLVPEVLPAGSVFTLDDLAPTQVDALPRALDADCIARVGDDEMRHVEFQGYRDGGFSERCVWYHVGTALLYRGKRRVRTIAFWLTMPPVGRARDVMECGDITVRVTSIVLSEVPAEKLLDNPKTVCLASGANPGSWSVEELCLRVAGLLRERDASWPERHVAVVAALAQGRYHPMVAAMEQMHMEPVIIEDLVKFGEERGEARGFDRGVAQGFDRGAAQTRVLMYENLVRAQLRRPLAPRERAALARRMALVSEDEFYEVVLRAGPDKLEKWLEET